MSKDLEAMVCNCTKCQDSRLAPAAAPLHPWEWPLSPWSRLHLDYAGPFQGRMFLVLVDAHSKWLDIMPVKNTTATETIEKLRSVFATHGIPDETTAPISQMLSLVTLLKGLPMPAPPPTTHPQMVWWNRQFRPSNRVWVASQMAHWRQDCQDSYSSIGSP